MSVLDDLTSANQAYAASFQHGDLQIPPARQLAILTCMDARLDPLRFAGLNVGDAHVIRNAGGRATDDAIRSLVISHKLLGTNVWLVIHHTNCGMELFDDETMGSLLSQSLGPAELGPDGWQNASTGGGTLEGRYVKWHTFQGLEDSVRHDVARIRLHPLVNKEVEVHGFVYHVASGRLIPVD